MMSAEERRLSHNEYGRVVRKFRRNRNVNQVRAATKWERERLRGETDIADVLRADDIRACVLHAADRISAARADGLFVNCRFALDQTMIDVWRPNPFDIETGGPACADKTRCKIVLSERFQ